MLTVGWTDVWANEDGVDELIYMAQQRTAISGKGKKKASGRRVMSLKLKIFGLVKGLLMLHSRCSYRSLKPV